MLWSGLFASVAGIVPALAATWPSEHYRLRLVTVADGLQHPWSLAWLPTGRMLVTERPGQMRIIEPDGSVSQPLAGLPTVAANGQGGLLDVAVDPGFADSRTIYFSFSEPGPRGAGTAVARAVLGDSRLENVEILFRQQPKASGSRHFGSRLVFGPGNTLFVTLGDRGERKRAQDLRTHFGQVVRILRGGGVPADNPYRGQDAGLPETWSHGHRNPQGAARNPESGELWIHEHGARGGDEINIVRKGRNYGWPVISRGRHYWGGKIGIGHEAPGLEQPVYYWDPSIAPSGMTFYTGAVFPEWKGNLLVGALKFRLLVRLELDGNRVVREERILDGFGERIRDVRQGPGGYVWLLTDSRRGQLLRLEPADR